MDNPHCDLPIYFLELLRSSEPGTGWGGFDFVSGIFLRNSLELGACIYNSRIRERGPTSRGGRFGRGGRIGW